MSCNNKLALAITNACDTPSIGGNSDKIIFVNYEDHVLAAKTLLAGTDIEVDSYVLEAGKKGYAFDFVMESSDADSKFTDGYFDHAINGMLNLTSNAEIVAIDALRNSRVVAFVETKSTVPTQRWKIFGYDSGLILTVNEFNTGADNAVRKFTVASSPKSKEIHSHMCLYKTSLVVTKAIITVMTT